jgi:DNA-binding IclR family transcriptional regulator
MAKHQALAAKAGLHGLAAPLSALHRTKKRRSRLQAGIQSLETGVALLKTLVSASGPMKLKDIAAGSKISASKAHRYMVSFCRTGLVAQDEEDAAYRLGPYALEMALACLNSLRPVRLASEALEAISREIGLTAAIAAWGNHGPTIVRIEESSHAVSMNVRAGTVVPVTRSASGLVFAAFMPPHVVEPLLAAELPRAAERREFEEVLGRVRRTGVAAVAQKLVPGADALAVPVFDHRAAVALSLLVVGSSGTFDLAQEGPVAAVLKRYALNLSAELGYKHA